MARLPSSQGASNVRRSSTSSDRSTWSSSSGGDAVLDARVPPLPFNTYEEGTQTESGPDVCIPTTSSGYQTADQGDSDGSDVSESESVMEKLSRGVYRLLRPDRCDRGTQTLKDTIVWETEKLAFDIVFFAIGRRSSKTNDEVMRCMRISVQSMLDKHALVFNGMMSRLKISRDCDIYRGFSQLAEGLFDRNQVSWGKIIALFAFGARVAQHCSKNGLNDLVFDIATSLSQFAVKKLTPFLKEHGGWATLCDAFPTHNDDYENKIWTSLLVTGVGLTTVAAFVTLLR